MSANEDTLNSRAHLPIPSYEDHIHCLEGEDAWQNFQGKDLGAAERMFLEAPYAYQEDFMWMGTPAFCYYFLIVDRYIRSIVSTAELDDNCVWILSACIGMHFDCGGRLGSIREEVVSLCDYVLRESHRFVYPAHDSHVQDRLEIEQRYAELREKALRHIDGQRPVDDSQ